MRRPLPFLFALLATVGVMAQHGGHERCAATIMTQRHLQEQGLPTDIAQALPQAGAGQRGGGTHTIPVVVHVVYNTPSENVPGSAIHAMINELNQDFSNLNLDLSGVRPAFTTSIGNPQIQFCLAEIDPQGNATTGITRTSTTVTWFDPQTMADDMKYAPAGRPAWNPLKYLNIWICDITSGVPGSSFTVGYAYMPVPGAVGAGFDGIVIDSQYGLPVGSRTTTHEAGHYLGLQHTWADGGCGVDDGFTDTPASDTPTYSCANQNLQKCGTLTQYENFMDYSNCPVMFTAQQGSFMRSILLGVRTELLTSTGCGDNSSGTLCIPTSQFGTSDGDYINSVVLGTINNVNSGGGPAYSDLTGTWSTSLDQGSTHMIIIESGQYESNNFAVWIDYDQNDVFSPSEKLGEFFTDEPFETQGIVFTVPAGATPGTTRMRVRGVYHADLEPAPTEPCFSYAYGETEDYRVIITTPGGSGVCIPASLAGTSEGDYINGVGLGSMNNVNSGGTNAPAYTDFSSIWSTSLEQGSTHTISVQGGAYAEDIYAVWIDYDQNNIFSASEKLGEFTTTATYQTQGITFTVPANAPAGNTIMRVRGVYALETDPTPIDPCHAYFWGETEDYGITITTAGGGGTCIPTSLNGTMDGDFINGVSLGTIMNNSSGGVGVPAYTNFSSTWSTLLVQGSTQSISIQGGEYPGNHYAAWIDYDQDGNYSDLEKIAEFTLDSEYLVQVVQFNVPLTATSGTTTMRVRGVYHDDPATDPCMNYAFGETEDYGIVITPFAGPIPCVPSSFSGPQDGDYINAVSLGDISNLNTGSAAGPVFTEYLEQSTILIRGQSYGLTIQSGGYNNDHYAAWIDLNGDAVFTLNEKLGEFTTTAPYQTETINFTVPLDAQLGATRLRVRGVYHIPGEPAPTDACHAYLYCETEDYTVIIELTSAMQTDVMEGIRVFPNPTNDLVHVWLASSGPAVFSVLDAQGRVVAAERAKGQQNTLSLSGIAAGHYMLRIEQAGAVGIHRLHVIH